MTRGFEVFRDLLDQFAAHPQMRQVPGGQRVRDVAARAGDPLRIAVRGRAGVGVSSVMGALGRTMPTETGPGHVLIEVPIPGDPIYSDVDVLVTADVLKPEDREALTSSSARSVPTVLVLNKADLTDPGKCRGPWSAAQQRCAQYRVQTGVPTLPLAAHVPLADIDDAMVGALRQFVDHPAQTRSVDAFVTSEHEVPVEMRRRLLSELDLYPIGCSVGALRQVPALGVVALTSLLRDISGIDLVATAIRSAIDKAWFRRMRAVQAELRRIAAFGDLTVEIDTLLRSDDLVIAAMRCAADAAAAVGLPVDSGEHPEDHRFRAMRWRSFAAGPVSELYSAVGSDIVRGSLRLWRLAGGRP